MTRDDLAAGNRRNREHRQPSAGDLGVAAMMDNLDRSVIWVVLAGAVSRTYDQGSLGWWFWTTLCLLWALVTIALIIKRIRR